MSGIHSYRIETYHLTKIMLLFENFWPWPPFDVVALRRTLVLSVDKRTWMPFRSPRGGIFQRTPAVAPSRCALVAALGSRGHRHGRLRVGAPHGVKAYLNRAGFPGGSNS